MAAKRYSLSFCLAVQVSEVKLKIVIRLTQVIAANGTSFIDIKDSDSASSDKKAKTLTGEPLLEITLAIYLQILSCFMKLKYNR